MALHMKKHEVENDMSPSEKAARELLEGYKLSLPNEVRHAKATLMAQGKTNEEAEKTLADEAYQSRLKNREPEDAKKAFLEKIRAY